MKNSLSVSELEDVKKRLEEAEATLHAIREGQVDAVVISKNNKNQVYTLRSADYIYRMLVEKMREGAITLTPEGIILYSNQQFADMMKMQLERVLGISLFDLVSPLNTEYLSSLLKQGQKKGSAGELELRKRNGENIPVHISVNNFPAEETPLLGMIITDLSRLKLAEIVDFSHDAIFRKNLDGILLSWNRGAENLFGYTSKEMVGASIQKIIPNYKDTEIQRINAQITKKQRMERLELNAVKKDRTAILLSLTYSPISDAGGKVIGASVIARDITKEREYEKQKDTLIGIASHELKTPVTTIKSFAQILAAQLKKNSDQKPLQYVHKLESQIDRISELINELLDVSKIEAGKLELVKEKFDLSQLAKEIVNDLQPTTRQKIYFKSGTKTALTGDKHRISQVLINLISNAMKYSPDDSDVIVKTFAKNGHVGACVQDFGVGIKKSDLDKVFGRFFQAENKLRKSNSGLGLGLYISHEIIKRHGGKIWLDSEPGKGSTFSFTLPLKN